MKMRVTSKGPLPLREERIRFVFDHIRETTLQYMAPVDEPIAIVWNVACLEARGDVVWRTYAMASDAGPQVPEDCEALRKAVAKAVRVFWEQRLGAVEDA